MPIVKPECDVLVIGAGIVGLATAAALARAGRSVVVVERHDGLGRETTSRNSQVLHGGLYYPAGSWKAQLCVAGSRSLYARCERERNPPKSRRSSGCARSGPRTARRIS
jgi:L-2-hydroxyglutarate oxidase LhgO